MANTNKKEHEVDFVPRISISNDLMKIYNSTAAQPADILLLNNLLNLLEMKEGTNKEFPSFGLAQEFAKLSFISESSVNVILDNIRQTIIDQLGHDSIQLSYEKVDPEATHSDIIVKIEIDNLPGAIFVGSEKSRSNSIAINTKYAK